MSNRFGRVRVTGCRCDFNFTCGACLDRAVERSIAEARALPPAPPPPRRPQVGDEELLRCTWEEAEKHFQLERITPLQWFRFRAVWRHSAARFSDLGCEMDGPYDPANEPAEGYIE